MAFGGLMHRLFPLAAASALIACPGSGALSINTDFTDAGNVLTDSGPSSNSDAGATDAGPLDAGPFFFDAGTSAPPVVTLLDRVANAYLDFHRDTGGWPLGSSAWYGADSSMYSSILPGLEFASIDKALFEPPPMFAMIPACDAIHTGGSASPCWMGPYLQPDMGSTSALGDSAWLDPWGHALLFAYVRPNDGHGGGISGAAAQNGLIFLWSMGPDGRDGFTCSDGSCAANESSLALGQCSATCDDVILLVSSNSD